LFGVQDWEGLRAAIAGWIKQGFPRAGVAPAIRQRYQPEVVAGRHIEIYREVLSTLS
jgi:hypothetical protein